MRRLKSEDIVQSLTSDELKEFTIILRNKFENCGNNVNFISIPY